MKKVSLKIEFEIDEIVPDEDIIEWVEFITGENGDIKNDNAMVDNESSDLCSFLKGMVRLQIDRTQYK